ncbi:hypothetical protein SCUCBS95973_002134 [Sporothrix curviconia]|uniref:Uncharacterized protein n=1 Tax=Sporothrix curviconia TaxID=1260050 RepID=A0ABP0B556_9PEZI
MSLARAFTTRRVRQTLELKDNKDAAGNNGSSPTASEGFLSRSKTTKAFTTHGSIRNKISAPVELTHTTNMLSYSAPDINPRVNTRPAAILSSPLSSGKSSDDESDSGYTAASTPPTSPDTPFPDDKRAMSPEPNHLSCYFMPPRQMTPDVSGLGIDSADSTSSNANANAASATPAAQAGTAAFPASDTPAIPKRAPSHTKKSYDGLARNRSVSRMSEQSVRSLSTKASFSFSRSSSSSSTSTSVTSTSQTATVKPSHPVPPPVTHTPSISITTAPPVAHKKDYSETHPFGHELAKVSELVEEFGQETEQQQPSTAFSSNPIYAEEERELARQGLKKYSAESYISDIQSLMSTFFADARPVAATATAWI